MTDYGTPVDTTCPVCDLQVGHTDDCSFCPECGEDCSFKGDGHDTSCSSWEPTDEQMNPSEWGPTLAESQDAARRLK